MNRFVWGTLLVVGLLCLGPTPAVAVDYKIVTASERGTYIKIGRDLAQFVAPAAGLTLEVLPSAGSAENVRLLRNAPGVKLALVQSDVYQSFLDIAAGGNLAARALIEPLRVIMPLYNEEIYFIVRADSERNHIHEIRNARINAGETGSGTALTSATLYRLMFGEALPDASASFLPNEEALARLVTGRTLDVVVVVAGQPAKLLADMKPESRRLIKLLKFDPDHASSAAVLKTYFRANVRATSYPNLLNADLPGLAVKAFLVTYNFRLKDTERQLRAVARSLCLNFPALREKGHPKWREVELALPPLGRGWYYYGPTAEEIGSCVAGNRNPALIAEPQAPSQCAQRERILGLCR